MDYTIWGHSELVEEIERLKDKEHINKNYLDNTRINYLRI